MASLASAGAAQEVVREGPFEKLVLDAAQADAWGAAEAVMETVPAPEGVEGVCLRFGVDVDHTTGEPKYPIGWPRTFRNFDEAWQRDWSGYDYLRFRVYTRTSREALPSRPVGLILYTPDKPNAYHRTLTELTKDEWVEFLIPLSEVPRHDSVTRWQFFISESDYQHGDRLELFVREICLLRYAEPTVAELKLGQSVAVVEARHVPVRLALLGLEPEATATVTCELRRGGKPLATTEATLPRGVHIVWLDVGERAPPGEYEVVARLGEQVAGPAALRLIAGPFAEGPGGDGR
jgi:hypothetical protein